MSENKIIPLQKKKYDVYLNDLKYKNKRNINKELANWMHPTYAAMFDKISFDSLEYRVYECIKSKGTVLDLSNMDLKEFPLDKIPSDLKPRIQYLFIHDNNLEKLCDLSEFILLEVLDISHNKIKIISNLPNTLVEINCKQNELKMLPSENECPKLTLLNCENNKIKNIPNYEFIKKIFCGNNEIEEIKGLNSENISCSNNKIIIIKGCLNLKYLDCSNNPLKSLSDTNKLVDLIMNSTDMEILPDFVELKYLELFNTKIEWIKYIDTLEDLFIHKESTKKISTLYKEKKDIEAKIYKKNLIHFIFHPHISA
jgi:Leucine-rich repeat (LRR) protein